MARKRRGVPVEPPVVKPAERPEAPAPAPVPAVADELRQRLGRLQPGEEVARPAQRPRVSFLTFWIAGEEYALPLERAVEIVRCESLTKVPQTPAWLRGVMNVRGAVVPVVDLAARLGSAEVPLGRRACALMIETDWSGESLGMGLLVEAVGRVVSVDREAVESVPTFGTRMRPELLAGLIPVDEGFAAVIDADRVLSAQELLPGEKHAPVPAAPAQPSAV
jgi:purine-binding chemotaxis protein CheW